jgi:hypothetical protein
MKDQAIVAWIPTKDHNLTMIGVYSVGGKIIDNTPRNYSQAETIAFNLSQQTDICQGHYIPVYL